MVINIYGQWRELSNSNTEISLQDKSEYEDGWN